MKGKAKILVIALIICALAISAGVGGVVAYLMDGDANPNVVTVGKVSVVLDEPAWSTTKGTYLVPGEVVSKNPLIFNNGENPAYVFYDGVHSLR